MTVIKSAIIKSYDAAAHKATVQIAGSLGVWLDGIRVATDIPAADVVTGRQCTVLFLDPSNQDDAVVITIQGALPSGGGGGATTKIEDADADTSVDTEASADEDKVRITIATTERALFQTATPHVTLTGDVRINNCLGIATPPSTIYTLSVNAPTPFIGGLVPGRYITLAGSWSPTVSNAILTGIYGQPEAQYPTGSVTTGHIIRGLDFIAKAGGGTAGTTISELTAIYAAAGANVTATVTAARGLYIPSPILLGTLTVTTRYGIDIGNMGTSKVADAYGIRIADINSNSGLKRLLELGKNPELRLESGDPAANVSQLLLAVNNGAVVVRRVEIGAAESGGAGYRMLRVLN